MTNEASSLQSPEGTANEQTLTGEELIETPGGSGIEPSQEDNEDGAGAEPEGGSKSRVYTEEEWNKRGSKLDKTIAELTKSKADLQEQLRLANERSEQNSILARQADEYRAYEEAGATTEQLAHLKSLQQREANAAIREKQLRDEGLLYEQGAKAMVARDLAHKYGIDEAEIIDAETPLLMEERAKGLSLKKENEQLLAAQRRPATFPTGGAGSTGTNWRDKSPDDKLRDGLAKMDKT